MTKRIPRPLGITYQCQLYNQTEVGKEKILNRIHNQLIEQYVANGMCLNGKQIPLDQFSHFLGLDLGTVIKLMNKSFERIGNIFQGEDGKAFARVGFLKAFNWALETAESIKSQSLLLKALQGEKYVPFLTSEYNKSLSNQSSALKPVIDLLKLMMEKSSENPILTNTQNVQNNIYVTPTEAAKLIEAKGNQSMLTNPELVDIDITEDLPEVGAKFQDLTKIGIRYNGENQALIESNEKGI